MLLEFVLAGQQQGGWGDADARVSLLEDCLYLHRWDGSGHIVPCVRDRDDSKTLHGVIVDSLHPLKNTSSEVPHKRFLLNESNVAIGIIRIGGIANGQHLDVSFRRESDTEILNRRFMGVNNVWTLLFVCVHIHNECEILLIGGRTYKGCKNGILLFVALLLLLFILCCCFLFIHLRPNNTKIPDFELIWTFSYSLLIPFVFTSKEG